MSELQSLVDQEDVAGLLRAIDRLCGAGEWAVLADLARRCRDAVELGRQLWAVATHIDYRLAREAPGPDAAAVLRPGAGRFALGPLTEVAASTHDWAALAPHLGDPAVRATVAQERALRGENLCDDPRAHAPVGAEPPPRLQAWEPGYSLPVYREHSAEFPQPVAATEHIAAHGALTEQPGARALPADDAVRALRDVVEGWLAESSATVRAVAVEGEAAEAVGCLRADRAPGALLAPVSAGDALALLEWAGASGGAHGQRRGGAAGRFAAWWAAAAVAGLDWPEHSPLPADFVDELGAALDELRWYRWRGPAGEGAAPSQRSDKGEGAGSEAAHGWILRLAVADPADGLAWALEAVDAITDPEATGLLPV